MAKAKQTIEIERRIPRQARAGETVSLILEATAQILEAGGLPAFTTNAVAERAGVSIGTLYQYFADKNAILLALVRQEMTAGLAEVGRALQGENDPSVEGRVRAMVRAMVGGFRGRHRARKAVTQAILAQGLGIEMMAPIAAFIAAAATQTNHGPQPPTPPLSPPHVFVLSPPLLPPIRHTALQAHPFLPARPLQDR